MDRIQKSPRGPVTSRRSIVRTAAWAVPVVAAVSAAPMAAASIDPVWDPTSNGTGGSLVYSGATKALTGYQEAWLGLDEEVRGTVRIPRLTATFNRSGAWGSPPPRFLGPAQQSLSVGSTLVIPSSGFTWVVASIDSTILVLSGGPATIPGSATDVRTPRIRISGVGDESGGTATMGVTLTGADGNDSGGTSTVQVGPRPAAQRAAAVEDVDRGDSSGGSIESEDASSDGAEYLD